MGKPKVEGNDGGERTSCEGDAVPRGEMVKKTYLKPVLSKHEQLHGIGLGSP